jgi:hypothetical protein
MDFLSWKKLSALNLRALNTGAGAAIPQGMPEASDLGS